MAILKIVVIWGSIGWRGNPPANASLKIQLIANALTVI
jgi:hypothetical protein